MRGYRRCEITPQVLAEFFRGGREHHYRVDFGLPPDAKIEQVEQWGHTLMMIVSSSYYNDLDDCFRHGEGLPASILKRITITITRIKNGI